MSDSALRQKNAQRQVQEFERKFGLGPLRLLYHAALPVALNVELLHLLRINFFLDVPEPLPYTTEIDILLSPLCREIGDGLYEIDAVVRDILLARLASEYGHQRIYQVAALLWQYSERRLAWGDQISLERAQQLTALNFLYPQKASQWLKTAEKTSGRFKTGGREWFVVMRGELERGKRSLVSSTKPRPMISIGRPEWWFINDTMIEGWVPPLNNYQYLLLRLAINLPSLDNLNRHFTEVVFHAHLHPYQSTQPVVVHSLYPQNSIAHTKQEVIINIEPDLHFHELESVKLAGYDESQNISIRYTKNLPVIQGFGTGESSAYWVFKPNSDTPLTGSEIVYLIAAVPQEANGLEVNLDVNANVEDRFGLLRLGLSEKAQNSTRFMINLDTEPRYSQVRGKQKTHSKLSPEYPAQQRTINPQDSVVLITGSNQRVNHFGTGFVFYRIEQGAYVLTCAHVVDEIGGREQLKVDGLAATVTAIGSANGLDLAVLYIKGLLDKPALSLGSIGKAGGNFVTAGFDLSGKRFFIRPTRGKLSEQVTIEARKHRERIKGWSFELTDDNYLQSGYSGAPVVDGTNGNVLGIITHRQDEDKKGLVISIEALPMIWPEMPSDLLRNWQTPRTEPSLPKPKPLMNFEHEITTFEKIVTGQDTETRLIAIYGASGMGKSRLLQEYERIAIENGLSVLTFNLQLQISIEDSLNQIVYHLGLNHFPHYYDTLTSIQSNPLVPAKEKEWWRNLTHGFFEELDYYPREARIIILFDSYEKADATFKDWLIGVFLPGIFAHRQLILVIAGKEEINPKPIGPGQHYFYLNGVPLDSYQRYLEECNVQLDPHLLADLHKLLHGQPQRFVEYIRAMQLTDEDRYNQQ